MSHKSSFFFVLFALALGLNACSKNKSDTDSPVVHRIEQKQANAVIEPIRDGNNAIVQPGRPAGSIESKITLRKSSILNRMFLYGAALQFSSMVDGDTATALMGISVTQLPANFRILDNKLRFETDDSINFESDVNHPSRLIFEFPVLAETSEMVTILADRASPALSSLLDKAAKNPRYSYIRSMEYAEADELILIESTVEMEDGSRAAFLESIRPRDKVIPANTKPIFADEELNPAAGRYRFLDAGEVFFENKPGVRTKTKAANRFLRKNGEPIKWYIYGNVPDAYINDVKNGVESWNRYSRAAGQPDLVRFEGKLPEGIKVGDPRFNTIVWDTVQEAGSAYESQNADPLTGVQTQSMIYIPLAWINIGKDYWNKMTPGSQKPGTPDDMRIKQAERLAKLLKSRKVAGRALPVNCLEAAHDLNVSARSNLKPEEFARELLKGVVMHEVGHALGLAHNFKGSLVYDANDPKKPFTTSIMDYNHYNEEDGAFHSLDTWDGPLLEYDRQIISVLYNEGKDVKDSDATLPACNDEEADSLADGVDPLCNRYDISADPTSQALRSLELFTKAGVKHGKMESITPQKVLDALIPLPPAASVTTKEELLAALPKGIAGISGTVGIYIGASANSFGYAGSQALRSLKVFQKEKLPEEGYSEKEMRERALQVFEAGSGMNAFPAVTKEAVERGRVELLAYLGNTTFITSMTREDREKVMAALTEAVNGAFVNTEIALLSRMRTRFISALTSVPTAPLAFHDRNGKMLDLEQSMMVSLEQLASQKAGSLPRPTAERAEALKALKSYSRAESYGMHAERVITMLKAEIQTATDPLKREESRKLLADFRKVEEEKKPEAK